MPQYPSPGVYVEEVSSAVQAIAGVGTSTAGFIGVIPNSIQIPIAPAISEHEDIQGPDEGKEYPLKFYPANLDPKSFTVQIDGEPTPAKLTNGTNGIAKIEFDPAPGNKKITVNYIVLANQFTNVLVSKSGAAKELVLNEYPVLTQPEFYAIRVNGTKDETARLEDDPINKRVLVKIQQSASSENPITNVRVDYRVPFPSFSPVETKVVKLCTNFSEFKRYFGDFSTDSQQRQLAHAVYGFFNNGGTRCYVMRVEQATDITPELLAQTFEMVDEIAIVAAPGVTEREALSALDTHCKTMGDRIAIYDSPEQLGSDKIPALQLLQSDNAQSVLPPRSDYVAFYFPWIHVFDSALRTINPNGDGRMYVPPSGHIAGIYARVDATRGVHKAPANEPIFGALGVKYPLSKSQQGGLNPGGVNCIRNLNGNIRVWGARTLGGDQNGEWRYLNVRRTFNFIRESIDEGLQWAVFEPNNPALWQKISRNATAFLTSVWRSGALFGTTPEEAFYVKCDAETNPPDQRELGRVITEIGVAIVRPAEFVIFRISQSVQS